MSFQILVRSINRNSSTTDVSVTVLKFDTSEEADIAFDRLESDKKSLYEHGRIGEYSTKLY
ncbi:hypothetical protein XaC1_182 [Xanthomonas phage XaC1]|nr:hypothetical protein XaC1_182 [Xanthomonas phage XaC1]